MSFRILSQEEFTLKNLVELIESAMERGSTRYSSSIECSLTELVKERMRRIVQEDDLYRSGDILGFAIQDVREKLQELLGARANGFDLSPYFNSAKATLKFPARELSDLGNRLRLSRSTKRIGERRRIAEAAQAPFEITEVGLQNLIEALIASPAGQVYELNLEEVKRSYEVEGDWFPFQIVVEEFEFVIDDDGTVFISTENFPEKLVMEAREILLVLAKLLYIRAVDS